MSMFKIFDIAGSAMSAQSVRLNTTASNLANVDSVGSSPESVYKSKQVVFTALEQEFGMDFDEANSSYAVKVDEIVDSTKPPKAKYQPDHPMANEEGYVYLPNISTIQEMANMISASRTYQTNAQMVNTAKTLMQRTLSMGQ